MRAQFTPSNSFQAANNYFHKERQDRFVEFITYVTFE